VACIAQVGGVLLSAVREVCFRVAGTPAYYKQITCPSYIYHISLWSGHVCVCMSYSCALKFVGSIVEAL
jgi:hypothetical protein